MEKLAKVKSKETGREKKDAWDYLYVFLSRYFGIIDKSHEIMRKFNNSQLTLLAYSYLDSQLCNGGFIQLIQNGYAGYIFDDPFSEVIKSWGAEETANIVEDAKKIYERYKAKLKPKTSAETSPELYEDIQCFKQLEKKYNTIKMQDVNIVKKYVETHINDFWENNIKPMMEYDDIYDDIVEATKNFG